MQANVKLSTQLFIYFLLAFLIAWGTWFPSFLHPKSLRLLSFVGLFAPAISAIIVSFYYDKAKGIRELFGRFTRFRFGLLWYIIAILLMPFLFTLSFLLDGFLIQTSFNNILLPTSPYFALAAFIWLTFINSGEEIGWKGFALPRLQTLFKTPLAATLVLGILWSTWHLPIYLTPGQSSFPVVLFFLFTVGLSFIYTVVFNKTTGSLFSAILLHAATDVVPRVLNITLFKLTTWLILGILTWVRATVFIFTMKRSRRSFPVS
ncbi:CPBP family intramembrane glutamic endopeptidase [Segetibacter koreensis]|uniref:CPBP family intramembrane glutamic endopeptidase n=1 Tax=Segetibacter koreensis TaxID=398037 RepID=UPI00037B8F02|nr:CPBP family intramembrane glutamic endopeptidase [Segetibacter koreensis]